MPGNAEWLQRVLDGAPSEESLLVSRFSARLLAKARGAMSQRLQRRLDPEDVLQSVFRSFFRRHREGQFEFQDENDVWRLLCVMTYRKIARQARFHSQDRRSVHREERPAGAEDPAADTGEETVIMLDILERLLQGMPETTRQIICLRLEDYSHSEIASRVGVSERTVRRSLARLRDLARQVLDLDESANTEATG